MVQQSHRANGKAQHEWTGLRQHFHRDFFNLLIFLSVEREQLALPNTETAEQGVPRGSKAVQKHNCSSDHKKMGSLWYLQRSAKLS